LISTGFTFDGITSQAMGMQIVRLDSSLPSRVFASEKQILEQHSDKALYPHFFGVKHTPLSFNIVITSTETQDMSIAKMKEIGSWLFKNEYKPFVSDDNPSKVFYVMFTNQADFYTNGIGDGYIELQARCRDGFGWTTPSIITHDLSGNTTTTDIVINNPSNVSDYYYPIVEIQTVTPSTGFSLVNNNDNNNTFTFQSLSVGEKVYIDNEKRQIISDTNNNRFSNFNRNWLRLKQGNNTITVTGRCVIKVKSEFPIFN
jgi:phage-related protein